MIGLKPSTWAHFNKHDRFELTAAAGAADVFAVATLNWTGRSLQLVPTASQIFAMDLSNEMSLPWLLDEVPRFLASMGIAQLILRRGAYSGTRRAHSGLLILETGLEFLPGLTVERVHTSAVTGWAAAGWHLPLPGADLTARHRKFQLRAIETAAYAAAKVLDARARRAARRAKHGRVDKELGHVRAAEHALFAANEKYPQGITNLEGVSW